MDAFSVACTTLKSLRKIRSTPLANVHNQHVVYTNPVYTCLSYMWGDGLRDCMIHINDKPFMIHKNLYDFLHVTRRRINQGGG